MKILLEMKWWGPFSINVNIDKLNGFVSIYKWPINDGITKEI